VLKGALKLQDWTQRAKWQGWTMQDWAMADGVVSDDMLYATVRLAIHCTLYIEL